MPEPTTVVPDSTVLNTPKAPAPVVKAPEDVLFNPIPPVVPVAPVVPADAKPPVTPAPTDVPPVTPTDTKPPVEPVKPDAKPTETAPKDYVLKAPEGSLLSPDDVANLQKTAKEAGLTQEQAEGILKAKDESVKAFSVKQLQDLDNAKVQWKKDCEKDPDIGGEKYAQNIELAHRAWDKVADKELRSLAEQTGFGSHPAVVRMLVRVGRMMSEDTLVRGSVGGAPESKSKEERLYPSMFPAA